MKLNISANITDSKSKVHLVTNTHYNKKRYQKLNDILIKNDKIYNENKWILRT